MTLFPCSCCRRVAGRLKEDRAVQGWGRDRRCPRQQQGASARRRASRHAVRSCGTLLSVSFGIVAQDAGMSQVAAIVMSAIVFAGSAQFTAIAILSQGGTIAAAIGAAALINSR
jgi:predicted branched-subunit amino acid permease